MQKEFLEQSISYYQQKIEELLKPIKPQLDAYQLVIDENQRDLQALLSGGPPNPTVPEKVDIPATNHHDLRIGNVVLSPKPISLKQN